eukprot:6849723-Prymnesium_polylepis.1
MASLNVTSGNPLDHLVHRYTHRVVRGSLLAVGRPDGRLNALCSAENTICLSVTQASSIQNLGVTCESITIGHNPYSLPLTAKHITLPTNRPEFICEAEVAANLTRSRQAPGSALVHIGSMTELQAQPTSPALKARRYSSQTPKPPRPNHLPPPKLSSLPQDREPEPEPPLAHPLAVLPSAVLLSSKDGSPESFLGEWMLADAKLDEWTTGQKMERQEQLQLLFETRFASLQRLVSFFVLFHAMGKAVQDFWPRVSFGLLGYDMSRSQSQM